MVPPTSTTDTETTRADEFTARRFDFIVVGGGTAGLVVAARLAENSALTVGVLEAGAAVGEDGKDDEGNIRIPGCFGQTLGGSHDWQFETVSQPGLGGRQLPWPRGKVLGGTSVLNFMTWNRASREDYDAWEALGNPGWGWDSLLPCFKQSETFHPPPPEIRDRYPVAYDPSAFGDSGPIHISHCREFTTSHGLWHATLNSLGVETNEAHFAGSNVGVWTNVCSINPDTAVRSYAVDYCRRLDGSSPTNLHILTGASVQEIVLTKKDEEWAATGVRFIHRGREFVASVSREVILSAGSVQSPQILELSGVGRPDVLSAAGVPVKVKSPNVGDNLQDHIMLAMIFEIDPSIANPDDLKCDDVAAASAREQYLQHRSGPLTILPSSMVYLPLSHFMPGDALATIASKVGGLTSIPAEQRHIMQRRFDSDAKKLGQVEFIFDLGNWSPYFQPNPADGKKYGTMLLILQHPFSRGSIHICPANNSTNSSTPSSSSSPPGHPSNPDATSPENHPLIDPGYYAGPHGSLDLEIMTHCARFADHICRASPLSSIIRARVFPAPPTTTNTDDDASLRAWAVDTTVTDWHPVGTCAMGDVVDERLRVRGVRGLRVVDASVIPLQISAHLQATVYAIAEKGARMIAEDLAGG